MGLKRILLASALGILVWLTALPAAYAQAKGLYEHQNTVIPEQQTVDDVVVAGGDVDVSGHLTGSLVVLNGDAELRSTARIKGFVVVIGGHVHQEPGASVGDQIISLSLDDATLNGLLMGGGMVAGIWLVQLAASVMLVLLPTAAVFLFKVRMARLAGRARMNPGHILAVGFFGTLMLGALSVLLAVTIVGIPVAILLLILLLAAGVAGLAALGQLIGDRIREMEGKPLWVKTLMGTIIAVSLMNVPIAGGFLAACWLVFSVGLATLWMRERWAGRKSG